MIFRHALAGAIFSFVFTTSSSVAPAADWYRWRGPDLNGTSRETGWQAEWPDEDPPVAWRASVGTGFSSVAVADGRLFTMGNEDNTETVYCLDAETGAEIWTHSYPCALEPRFFEGGPTSTPTVDGENVYTLSREGHLFCFEAATGEVRWSKVIPQDFALPAPGWGFAGSPLVHENLLLLNAGGGGLALDKKSGDAVWKSDAAEAGYSTPVPFRRGDRWLAMFSSGKAFLAADLESGEEQWRFSWLTRFGVNAADPILASPPAPGADGELVFLSSGYGKGAALIRAKGDRVEEVWKNKEMHNQMNPCLLIDGFLYGMDGDEDAKPELKCVELESGKTMWSAKGLGGGALMAADGRLIIMSGRGELIISPVSPEKLEEVTRFQVLGGKCWTVPVLANGRIYCRNAEGDLACVDVRPKK